MFVRSIRYFALAGLLLAVASPVFATTDVYLFGGQSNMNTVTRDAFVASLLAHDPSQAIATGYYRSSGKALDSGWDAGAWLGDPPGPGRQTFYPGLDDSDPITGTIYSAMIADWQTQLTAISGEYAIKGIIWIQGEQDTKQQVSAERYATNLQLLSDRIHSDLGLGGDSVPLYYSKLLSTASHLTYADELRTQQENADHASGHADSIPNAVMVETAGLSFTDGVHYDAGSQVLLGQRFATAATHVPSPAAVPACSRLRRGGGLVCRIPPAHGRTVQRGAVVLPSWRPTMCPSNPAHEHPSDGFTLIELLVVVTIIIALLAVLMLSMNRAIEMSQRVVCASNLDQLHTANLVYASDNYGQTVPGTPTIGATGQWGVYHTIVASMKPWDYFFGHGILYQQNLLPDGKLMYCPSNTHPIYQYDSPEWSWLSRGNGLPTQPAIRQHYWYRSTVGRTDGSIGRALRLVDSGAEPIMADGFGINTGSAEMLQTVGVDTSHRVGYTVARLGGSVEFYHDPDHRIGDYRVNWTDYSAQELVWSNDFSNP